MSYFLNLSTLNQSLIMFSFYLFHQRANLTRVNNTLERNESYHHVKTTLAKESKRSCDQNGQLGSKALLYHAILTL